MLLPQVDNIVPVCVLREVSMWFFFGRVVEDKYIGPPPGGKTPTLHEMNPNKGNQTECPRSENPF